jgi:hypothetical protein
MASIGDSDLAESLDTESETSDIPSNESLSTSAEVLVPVLVVEGGPMLCASSSDSDSSPGVEYPSKSSSLSPSEGRLGRGTGVDPLTLMLGYVKLNYRQLRSISIVENPALTFPFIDHARNVTMTTADVIQNLCEKTKEFCLLSGRAHRKLSRRMYLDAILFTFWNSGQVL